MLLSKINFRGIEGYIKEGDFKEEKRADLFYYDLRHKSNNWAEPYTIEDFVVVNYWGTICFKQSIRHLLEENNNRVGTELTEQEIDSIWFAVNEATFGEINHNDI